MGCDIHMYVEYRRKDSSDEWGQRWQSFGGRMSPGRNYDLFGFLAGVRGGAALVNPRGLPKDIGWNASFDANLFIVDDESSGDGVVSRARAKEWVERKISEYTTYDKEGQPNRVSHPDWHTHSWLTPDELKNAMSAVRCGDGYHALLAAMKELERRGNEVRVVFWFDN